jgi:hypothetical protein
MKRKDEILDKYYWELETVMRVINGLLEDKERDESKIKEGEILIHLPAITQSGDKKKVLCRLLKEYDGMITVFIHNHKLDIPPKRDRTVMIA